VEAEKAEKAEKAILIRRGIKVPWKRQKVRERDHGFLYASSF
jgi:hypothetical protein